MFRKTKKPIDMSQLLETSDGTLAQIAVKTNFLTNFSSIIRDLCPDLPEDAWHLGNVSNGTLLIEVKSSAWGQRLQFEKMNIAKTIAQHSNGIINKIDIKVNPFFNKAEKISKTSEKTQFISEQTAERLKEVASLAPESLKVKIERLANLAHSKNKKD